MSDTSRQHPPPVLDDPASTAPPDADRQRVQALLEEWILLRDQGRDISVTELCRECPHLGETLAEEIALYKRFEPPDSAQGRRPEPPVKEFAGLRYQPLRYHAQGGLGVVFVARDTEVGRDVALKRIQERRKHLTRDRERFPREAEITGRLEHPGIVPVYSVGRDTTGQPYYTMRLVQGRTLAEAIEVFHQGEGRTRAAARNTHGLRALLTRFVTMCQTVGYAHSRGVIHRDLKPSNVLLGGYGETLVIDWGLARPFRADGAAPADEAAAPPSGGDNQSTQAGQAVGTPAYMSPEQARGDWARVGLASDVFSLGATLYHLLTGRPPYVGAAGLDDARAGKFARPRKVSLAIPPALEATCLKAMAARPGDRYPAALELAADVQRWLDDEPVRAYREPWPQRLGRWGRRNRTLVAAAVVVLAAGVVGLSLGLWAVGHEQARTAEALKKAEDNLGRALAAEGDAKRNLGSAEANLKLARQAIDECFNIAKTDPLFQEPRMERAKKLLLEKTLPFYRNFRAQRPDDPALPNEEAEQWFRVGYIEFTLARTDEARHAYEQARDLLVRLVKARPETFWYQHNLALVHNDMGYLLERVGRRAEAFQEYQQAQALQAKLVKAYPQVAEYQRTLAATHTNRGNVLLALGKAEEAAQAYEQSHHLHAKLVQAHPDVPEYQNALARTHNNRGWLLASRGRRAEALREYQQGQDLQAKLVKAHPEVPEYQNALAVTHTNRGNLLLTLGRGRDALQAHQQAHDLRAKLVKEHPELPTYQNDLAVTHNNRGFVLAGLGRREEALKEYQLAGELQAKLVRAHPGLPRYQNDLAVTHNNRGNLLAGLGRAREALQAYQQARDLQSALLRAHPDVPRYQNALARTHNNRGLLLDGLGRREEALKEYQLADELQAKLVKAHPDVPEYRNDLARTHNNRGNLLTGLGRAREALQAYQQAHALQSALLRAHPDVPEYQDALALTHNNRGKLLDDRGRPKEALKEYQLANDLQARLVQAHPDVPEYLEALGVTHNNRGNLLAGLGRGAEAFQAYQQALDLRAKLVKAHRDMPGYQDALARTHYSRGLLLDRLGRAEEALQAYEQAHDLQSNLVKAHPEVPGYVEGLTRTHLNRGAALAQKARYRDSLADLDQGIRLLDRLSRLDPGNSRIPSYQLTALGCRAYVWTRLGRPRDADADWDRALAVAPAAQRPELRLQRGVSRATGRALSGDYRGAAAEADDLARAPSLSASNVYNLACVFSISASAAARDSARPPAERTKDADGYAYRAVALLERARQDGFFRDPAIRANLDRDEDLAFLRDRDDYRAFVKSFSSKK
jgi:serine/threonine-protein kinase